MLLCGILTLTITFAVKFMNAVGLLGLASFFANQGSIVLVGANCAL
ncbi:MAG: hypothetical protein IJU40_02460 [Desulfovibrionaceae bacterium]|nr:hypothetical protein [Desulfovibrionaceae bacterium]